MWLGVPEGMPSRLLRPSRCLGMHYQHPVDEPVSLKSLQVRVRAAGIQTATLVQRSK